MWDAQVKQVHIVKVVVVMVVLAIVIGLVIFGLVYPKCNSTQVRGFFQCNCAPGSALNKVTKLCHCLNDASTLGGQCEEGAAKVRFVFSAEPLTADGWKFTQAAYTPTQ
jgi:hypothetical protein